MFGIAVDGAGNIYLADLENFAVRKIDASGMMSTIAGTGPSFSEDGATSALSTAMFPSGVAADSNGHLYIADILNNQVFLVYLPGTFKPSRETAGRDFRAIGDWRRWRPWGSRCRRR